MLSHVFVVSEWLPKETCDEELWALFKELMALTKCEKGCLSAHATAKFSIQTPRGNQNTKLYFFKNMSISQLLTCIAKQIT